MDGREENVEREDRKRGWGKIEEGREEGGWEGGDGRERRHGGGTI